MHTEVPREPSKNDQNVAIEILDLSNVLPLTIKAYHGVKRDYYGRVYQVAVEFNDNVVRWVNPEELINARSSFNQYLDKLNIPNPKIN